MSTSSLPTEFGIFYPTGWMVLAFPDLEAAERVRRDLLTGGYDEEDCRLVEASRVVPAAAQQLEDAGFFAQLGKADEAVALHLAAAKRGAAFLIVYAPSDAEAERVMNVARRVPFEFAHRYRRFAIQDMK